MKSKKGELTTQQIVLLIILILSFAVILFFYFRLNLGKESESQVCHDSVMRRAQAIEISNGATQDAIPLNCKRQYVCITQDGSCEKLVGSVDKQKVKTKEEVYQVLADQLATCWWTFGEGKVNYIGKESFTHLYCSLCAQISFDNSVQEKIFTEGSFPEIELYYYMATHNYTEGQTYNEYLYAGVNDVSKITGGSDPGLIYLDREYNSFMAITSDVGTLSWIKNLAIVGGITAAGLALAPFTGGGSVGISAALIYYSIGGAIVGGTSGFFAAPVIRGFSDNDIIAPTLVEAGSEELRSYQCDYISTLS